MNKVSVPPPSEVKESTNTLQSPWLFVSTLYFAEGIPYILVNSVSVVLYKKLGVDNAQIALWTSLLYLPWVLKIVWAPLIDIYSTKRYWILYSQFALMVCLGCLALSLHLPNFFGISLLILTIAAFISATQDIATDGFYMLALDQGAQAFFVGIRSTFYRIAMIFGSGLLVFLAGQLEVALKNIPLSWTIAFSLPAFVFAILLLFHWLALPFPEDDRERSTELSVAKFYAEVIRTYFKQEKIWAVIAFIFLYRIGEAMLVKLAPPFLLDATEAGGLGLSTSQVGIAYGTLGAFALTAGGMLGGWLVSRYGVKRSLLPMAIALNLPHLFYIYLAYVQPSVNWVYPLVAIEQFGYGLGTAAYSVYFMYLASKEYKTSHFAISTGIMALGMMLPGLISGYIQQTLGYQQFFVFVFLLTIPGMLTLLFLPLSNYSDQQ
jgi:PAT family beta-lactamase induction signal transducer AmpG